MTDRRTIVRLVAAICLAIASILALVVLGPSNVPVIFATLPRIEAERDVRVGNTPQPARFTVHDATADDLDRLGDAAMAFATAGLELPTLDVWFHTNRQACGEYHGLFKATSESWQIRICSEITSVVAHELAHAWIAANVDGRQRSAFMNLRGLEHWADRDVPWNERGTEWAAVTLQQGLKGLPLPPVLSNEAKSRLAAFELLTGGIAPVLVEWIRKNDVPCSDRPTDLSRSITDATGRSCAVSRSL